MMEYGTEYVRPFSKGVTDDRNDIGHRWTVPHFRKSFDKEKFQNNRFFDCVPP